MRRRGARRRLRRFVRRCGRPGGRRRQNLSIERETEVLAPFLDRAQNGGILVVPQIKAELDGSGIYLPEEVKRFCEIYFKPKQRQSPADHQAMNAALDPAVDRFSVRNLNAASVCQRITSS